MRAIVGLGNPGPEYARTRHNAGFVAANALAEHWGLTFRRAGRSRLAEGSPEGVGPVCILKPQTYMNRSGTALGPLLATPEFDPATDLLVVVDEAVLPLGRLRFRPGGSAGGHNGLRSVQGALQSQDFGRLRIGVGPQPEGAELADYVLAPFPDEEWTALRALLPTIVDAIDCWTRSGVAEAMNRFNQPRTSP